LVKDHIYRRDRFFLFKGGPKNILTFFSFKISITIFKKVFRRLGFVFCVCTSCIVDSTHLVIMMMMMILLNFILFSLILLAVRWVSSDGESTAIRGVSQQFVHQDKHVGCNRLVPADSLEITKANTHKTSARPF